MTGSLQSIMERKIAEDALRRSQQFLQEMADNTTAVIYVKEANGRYILVNRRFEQIFGLKADQIIGFTDHQIFPRHFADVFRANDVAVLERNSTVEYEETAPHLDGSHTYISIKFPLRDQAGIPYALCGVSTDITERKQAEDLLRSHERQLRLALSSTEIGVWSWDVETDCMVGSNTKFTAQLALAKQAAASNVTVLILGETGTGKEVVARAIHGWSPRRDKPFVAVNCAAIPKDLLENELFGHEKGAFTGAVKREPGKIEIAEGGTVFLDEIGDMSLSMVASLHSVKLVQGIE